MKKLTMFFCLGAMLVVFGNYGVAFASTEYPEPSGARSPDDLEYITDPGDGELLYGLITVNISGENDVVHCTLFRGGNYKVKEKPNQIDIKMKGNEYHLFSFQTNHFDFCTYVDENGISAFEEALLEAYYAQPYLSFVDEAFGFTTYEGGAPVWPIGIPVLDHVEIIRLENCEDDINGNEMIFGFVLVRVFEWSPPEEP